MEYEDKEGLIHFRNDKTFIFRDPFEFKKGTWRVTNKKTLKVNIDDDDVEKYVFNKYGTGAKCTFPP
jgi:hypothetical protein